MVGILALQGDYSAHTQRLAALGHDAKEIRCAADLSDVTALVLPGGESSVFLKLLDAELEQELTKTIQSGVPTLATCAGIILLAESVKNPEQRSLGLLKIGVTRNAYGRQVDSFIDPAARFLGSNQTFEAVFIRAPKIDWVGKDVQVLVETNGSPTLVRQGNILGATFHPELSDTTDEIYELLFGVRKALS